MKQSIKDSVAETLAWMQNTLTKRLGVKAKNHKYLFNIMIWQEASKYADDQLEKAWKEAQAIGRYIGEDPILRGLGEGEHIVAESGSLSCLVKVSAPRETFSRELFIAAVAKKYKLREADLIVIADTCKIQGNRSLTKRVLEYDDVRIA